MRITLFERFSIVPTPNEQPLRLRTRAQRVVAYLVLRRDRPLPREQVAFALWPDATEESALASLRRALNDLRAALGPVGAGWPIAVAGSELRWEAQQNWIVDLIEYERLIARGTPAALHAAVELHTGALLADWDDEWVVPERERIHTVQVAALRELANHHRALGALETALALTRRGIQLDPLSESDHRALMELHALRGDRAAALSAYERLRAVLHDELGVEPMPETEALRQAIVSGAPLLRGAPPAPPTRPAGQAQGSLGIVGRDAELRRLTAAWDTAVTGDGTFAVMSGEAGIGKSRLARALAEHAAQHGGLVLTGQCYRLEQSLPYQPVTEMLRAAASALRHADLAPAHRATLGRLAPDVVGIIDPEPTGDDGGAIDPRGQLFEALLQAFLALARIQPLLLLIEDLHNAADATIDWLAYIVPQLPGHRVMVVATYRTDETNVSHALVRLQRRHERENRVTVISLPPLSSAAMRELVVALSRLSPEDAQPLAERLHRATAGNPFFMHEILRGLEESGQVAVSAGRWDRSSVDTGTLAELPLPASLRATIAARVQRLSETARTFLIAAAVAGRTFRYDIVRDAGDWNDERALDALEELIARNFITAADNDGGFTFSHDLVCDAVYADLSSPRRAYWHQRIADAWVRAAERLSPAQQAQVAGQIAFHAIAGKRDEITFRWAPLAAECDARLYSYGSALRLLEAASAAFERLRQQPDFDSASGERRMIDILLQQSALMPHVGRPLEEHGSVLQQVAELLARYPDDRRQARFELRQSDYLADQRRYEQAARTAIVAAERCKANSDPRGAAEGFYQAGKSWLTVGRNREASGLFQQSRALYQSIGDVTGDVLCLSGIAWAHMNLGEVEIAMQRLQDALTLSERQADKAGMARTCYSLAAAWAAYYNPERTMHFAERAAALYREIGFAWTAYRPLLFIGIGHMLRGDLEHSAAVLQQVVDEAHAIEDSWLEGWGAQLLGRLALEAGDLPRAEHLFQSALALRRGSGESQNQIMDLVWHGRLRLAQGRPQEARVYTEQAMEQLAALGDDVFVWELPDVLSGHAEVLEANGDWDGAQRYKLLAHHALQTFVAQMGDPDVKAQYLSLRTNQRVIAAAASVSASGSYHAE